MANNHKAIAEDTIKIINDGFYYNQNNEKLDLKMHIDYSVDKTKLYAPAELEQMLETLQIESDFNTIFEVCNETSLDAVRRVCDRQSNTLCLNFASAKNPGGGFLGGAVAQEESIARASALYPCLLNAIGYYEFHRSQKTCLYSDHMIYSPQVPVFKDEEGKLMDEIVKIAIITSPAVNAGAVKRNEPENVKYLFPVMQTRMDKMLALCTAQKHKTLVLGAWGCGVFQNDPDEIAGMFEYFLNGKYKNVFEKIVFAVKANNERFIEPFRKRFF